ncbi:MAG: preprotein translocase subunit YajC [Nocardioides sp.]|uniref:preprotein translocase subunit YajC n=1 Tax=Nocardioides sp. TaxID=35761 RepID=UPI003F07E5A0
MELLVNAVPFVLVLLFFWLFLIRPQQRRQREVARMQSEVGVGSRVMLSSGIFGTVTSVTDQRARVELAPGVEVEVMRAAIAQVDAGETSAPAADATDAPDADAADTEQA